MIELHLPPRGSVRRFCTLVILTLALLGMSDALRANAGETSSADHAVTLPALPVFPPAPGSASSSEEWSPQYAAVLQKGTLLVANQYLADPHFVRAVVLLLDYGTHGAMGLVINRPTNVRLSDVFPTIGPLRSRSDRLYMGGPVAQQQIMLLLRTDRRLKQVAHIFANIFLSGSEATLKQLLAEWDRSASFHAYVGYAGWAPGQLEDEVNRGDWRLVSPDSRILFDVEPLEIWHELLRRSSGLWVYYRGVPLGGYAP
ncbi:MAG: YqgE/AlgH family protein [Gammaproteobacteria bacterium]